MAEPTQEDFESFRRSYGWSKVINILFYVLVALAIAEYFREGRPQNKEDWSGLGGVLIGVVAVAVGLLSGIAVLIARRHGKRTGEWGSKQAHLYVPAVLSVAATTLLVVLFTL